VPTVHSQERCEGTRALELMEVSKLHICRPSLGQNDTRGPRPRNSPIHNRNPFLRWTTSLPPAVGQPSDGGGGGGQRGTTTSPGGGGEA
jgi:hypothetical protein